MDWFKIDAEISEQNFVKQIQLNGKNLCLIHNNQQFYVIQNKCPHAGGVLSNGWCENGSVVCPVHRWKYNLQNGRGAEGQGDYVTIYPVEHRHDGVYVGFKESWLKNLLKRNKD
jgi:nitrite reductase/ring-hydroxylating ferredoxin subunit